MLKKIYYELSDPWQDYGPHNTQFGFPATGLQGKYIAEKYGRPDKDNYIIGYAVDENSSLLLDATRSINYGDMLEVDIGLKGYKPEVFISNEDKMEAHKVIYEIVGNEPFGFIQTLSGDPDRSLPPDYGREWLASNKNLQYFIEIEKEINVDDLSINAMFEVMKHAAGVVLPNSIFWQAAGAMGKKVDLAYFSRGEDDLNKRKYEIHYGGKLPPFYDEEFYKTVVFELPQ